MKRNILLTAVMVLDSILSVNVNAQVAINTDGSAPNSSAMLDITSTDKGILIPRVASTGDVTSPATGLLVYQSSDDAFYYWDGGLWIKLGSQWNATTGGIYYNNGVAAGGITIDASAIMDVQSDALGILIPRLTESAKFAITAPANGLLIYQTDGSPTGFYFFDGSSWKTLAGLLSLTVDLPLINSGGTADPVIGLSTPLAVSYGGTGATTFGSGSILYGAGTFTINTSPTFVKTATGVGIATSGPNSTLHIGGSFATAYVGKSGAYTLTSSDQVVNATSGTFTITLPTAVGITSRIYTIKNSGAGIVTIGTTSGQTIDGAGTYSLASTNKYVTVISNGSNWLVIGNN